MAKSFMFLCVYLGSFLFFNPFLYAETVQFSYDNTNQLSSAVYSDGSSANVNYDAVGNRTTFNGSPASDADGDGLSDYLEALSGTLPDNPDTDGDGILDGDEDQNRNGWKDTGETTPLNSDTDSDGMDDGWEVTNHLDPIYSDAGNDPDQDGFTNIEEYNSGSDPFNPLSTPVVSTSVPAINLTGLIVLILFLGMLGWVNIRRQQGSKSKFFFLILLITFLSVGFSFSKTAYAMDSLPGIQNIQTTPVSPAEAQQYFNGLQAPVGLKTKSSQGLEVSPMSAIEINSDIQAMARALKNNVDLIYEFVYNKIEYTPIFGSLKGAQATLIDRIGNDFDQSSLMIALLRAAGYTASYKYGTLRLDPSQVANFLGVDNNVTAIGWLLGSTGIPAQIYTYPDSSLAYVDINHVWVDVDIDGTHYVFAPGFKTHAVKPGMNLATTMGYDQTAFLSNAMSGAAQGSDYVQNVNKANISNTLTTYADNLIQQIESNAPGATLGDVIGEKTIVPVTAPIRQTSLPTQQSVIATWTEIPASYRTTLRVQHSGIDSTLYSDEIYGKRLTIFYNTSNQPVLRLDGAELATGTAATPDTNINITLTANHPYAGNGGTYGDQSRTFTIQAGGSYTIVNGWAETGRDMVEKHRKTLNANKFSGAAQTSEEVLGQTLTMMGFAWLAQCHQSDILMDQMFKTATIHHHTLGVCGQNASPYIDMPMGFVSTLSLENNDDAKKAAFFSASGRASALEWGIIEQHQDHSAVCTVKLLDMANERSDKIFEAFSANWSSVQSQLTGYSSNELANVNAYISAGFRVILPQNGDLTQGSWQGLGFLAVSSAGDSIGHIISGGLKGGFADTPFTADPVTTSWTANLGETSATHATSSEPIDLVTGHYLYEATDLTIGGDTQPFGFAFGRSYNSGNRYIDGPFGLGWTHGFDSKIREDSDGFISMGERSPIEAAAIIVEIYVTTDLLMGSKTNDRLTIASIGHRWFMDRMINNVVNVDSPGNTRRFVRLADGTFSSPPGDAGTLTLEPDSTYLLRTSHGEQLDFNTDGQLTAWIDTNGNTLSLSYTSHVLSGITNNMGRTITLTWTGNHISQVSDNTGRSVDYHYDGDNNLERITDVRGFDTTYQYDLPGRMTRIFYPDNPTIPFAINGYGSDDRVITQTDANGNEWQYYISGYRSEEVNPLGNSNTIYFDDNQKVLRRIDPLGNEHTLVYDGQQRLVKETRPEGNYTGYLYDARHNPVTVTEHPKPGSGLTPLVTQFTYDPAFNKMLTATDSKGRITTLFYDANGNLERMEQPQVDGSIPVTLMTYNSKGQVLTKTDPEGRTTRYTYDPATGDLLSSIVDDAGLNLTTQYAYNSVGNVLSVTDPNGQTTTYAYDNGRLMIQETGPAPFNYIIQYDYDKQGRPIETRRETGDVGMPWQATSVTYTNSGKKHIITDPEGHQTTHVYDTADRLWKITNAENQTTEYQYDAAGRIFQVIDARLQIAQEFTYTANGLKALLKDANTNTTSYTYDGFDRNTRVTFPDASYEAFIYDETGNLTQKRTRTGDTITYAYDDLNRIILKTLPSGTVSYTYDLTGLQETMTDNIGTIRHQFDDAMRLLSVQYPDGKTVGYQYDNNNNRTRLTYPDNTYITYQYDELNRLTHIRQDGTTLLAHYAYDRLSRRINLTYGNGNTTTYGYQIDNDLASLSLGHAAGTVNLDYTTNNIGIRTQKDIDDFRFVYRPAVPVNTAYTVNPLNQYTAAGPVSFAYDTNGNMTDDGLNTYTYDAQNRLISAVTPDHTVTYAYDPMGRRVEKTIDSQTIQYLHDGNEILVEYDGSGSEIRRYIYGPGIDEPICMIVNSNLFYYQFDGQGSVVALSDETGNFQEIYAYSLFGTPNGKSLLGNPYLFTGRAFEPETGLYYYRARYYNSALGRFLQTDPIGYADSLNLYTYVGNSPISLIDPLGLCAENMNYSAMIGALGISGGLLVDDASIIGVADNIAIPVILLTGAAAVIHQNQDVLAAKMEREIARIQEKITGPQGVQYSLRALVPGEYPNVSGGTTYLEAGDVWKYGETTNPDSRYSESYLRTNRLRFTPEYAGNQVEIKVAEKLKIYGHFFSTGQLPPGNKIFR